MNNSFENLEKRCKILKIKKILMIAAGGLLAISCVILIYEVIPEKKDIDNYVIVVDEKEVETQEILLDEKYASEGFVEEDEKEMEVKDEIQNEQNLSEIHKDKVKATKEIIEELREGFIEFPSYQTAISLARKSLEIGRLKESAEWSLRARKLDGKQFSSYIIFAEAKFRLGDEETAIKTLEMSLEKNYSQEVKDKLVELKKRVAQK